MYLATNFTFMFNSVIIRLILLFVNGTIKFLIIHQSKLIVNKKLWLFIRMDRIDPIVYNSKRKDKCGILKNEQPIDST